MFRKGIAILLAAILILACCPALAEIWSLGKTGNEVTRIQEKLIELRYLDGEPTGIYDEEAEAAVRCFQEAHGLLATGMVDPITMKKLMAETEPAYTGDMDDVDYEEDGALYESYYDGGAMRSYAMAAGMAMPEMEPWDTNEYTHFESNGFQSVATNPLSTFAADVDTSSYAQFRRRTLAGEPVPADSIRIEEMLNYFHYDYAHPQGDEPFGVTIEIGPCPWNEETRLMQIGLQAKEVDMNDQAGHNLVFLIDTSGSMYGEDRLDLVKRAFLLLLDALRPEDTVSIVAYASMDRVVIEGVPAREKTTIMEAINSLQAEGYTNGSAGILRAYEIAEKYFVTGGVNRILLATDGDLNMGVTSEGELVELVMDKKEKGVQLTCLGFGMGNYKDNKMEALADYGDGNCRYIDTIYEARKALIEEAGGTFVTVAKDVKIQVDFNPAFVKGYRLIGYEDRMMAAEDFANDEKDGGEIGSGHRMTALYELVPAGSDFEFGEAESRYTQSAPTTDAGEEMLTVAIRAKEPEGTESRLYEYPVRADAGKEQLSDNIKFAAAVAEVGMCLRDNEWKGTSSYAEALSLLRDCAAVSGDVYKEEFLYLTTLLDRVD